MRMDEIRWGGSPNASYPAAIISYSPYISIIKRGDTYDFWSAGRGYVVGGVDAITAQALILHYLGGNQ